MDIITIQEQLETILNQVDPITQQYHEAKTDFENLEEQKKVMLAFYSMQYEGSEAKIQKMALQSKEYRTWIETLNLARKEYNRCWALLEGLKIKMDILRSLNKNLT